MKSSDSEKILILLFIMQESVTVKKKKQQIFADKKFPSDTHIWS